jgi:choline dehydrogenase-like flavoprotein
MRQLDCDVLIVGSGAAGAVLAATLAERTKLRIVLLERGGHFGRESMTQNEWEMSERLYAEGGMRRSEDGAAAVRGGECVGGGTTVNVALCLDPVPRVWSGWQRDFGLTGFSFDPQASDYDVEGLNMTSCLAEVKSRLNIHEPEDAEVNDNNRLFAEGCRALGIRARKFELNMRGCVGCGFCFAGCAYDAKQGTLVTYVPDAIARGVQLVHHCEVERLEFDERDGAPQVVGALARISPTREGSRPNSLPVGEVRFRARLVIVSAGAIGSPALLHRSHHPDPSDVLGRGLVIHPSLPVIGVHEQKVTNVTGIEGTMYSDHFVESHGFLMECLFAHPSTGAALLPSFGPEHFELMKKLPHVTGFGSMLLDSSVPENRVVWNESERRPAIHYRLPSDDRPRFRFAVQKGVEVMFASGAKEVLLPSEERLGPLELPRFKNAAEAVHCQSLAFARDATILAGSHCQATVKMGADPKNSVVNSRCESHQVRNLLVCDGSSFPGSCGANPMVSILTLARYQGRRIAAELSRYGW